MSVQAPKIRIGDILIEQGVITDAQLMEALAEQKKTGRKLGRTLVEMELVQEDQLLRILSDQLGIPYQDLDQLQLSVADVQKLPETLARRYRVLCLGEKDGAMQIAMADPSDIFGLDEVRKHFNGPVSSVIAREGQIMDVLDKAYQQTDEIANLAGELEDELAENAVTVTGLLGEVEESDAPVVRLLEKLFEEAVQNKASDIHIEPDETVLRIRRRIDGVLYEQIVNESSIAGALVVRLKLMASLDISEKRLPQDGRFHLMVRDHKVDVRLSTMPVQYGESVVLRILDQTEGILPLDKVGMTKMHTERFRSSIQRPHGLILVTGPTGSGKTTTLYGAVSELNSADKKIITVEDPVEYRLPRVNQVQINEKIGLDFSTVLRATLRQDPDILLVGEIRDADSAEIAMRAAMTGHLVLSTLHTNDALSSALRLVDMGVDPYLVAASLKTIVAQRLIRRVCRACSEPYEPNDAELRYIESLLGTREQDTSRMKKGSGCASCNHTGYRGRIGIFEILDVNEAMAKALRGRDVDGFNQAAIKQKNFIPLGRSALAYALQGLTSLEEVMRICAMLDDESQFIEAH
ncbi:GspE/PulE family protein [Pseudoteredinibacter isoporae]|uniref:MSHA biogenesis protein MshE n=1 Tax=Pseudoteredinibacter isoporae TaxID=570281 RepID=A0A7X0JU80_9GAMM|nr:GspE/PulE family protein [Pseudoteredinibacter isoporae]MBB6522358.1 MSHA biogenesis protein MshE [Pseudoteredinibacter isoporae]NHO87891.1 type II/IV secretion system protein [Pseudoteredinibacter isoporae]NIB23778.1 type II/IV secretion system protein [Pseudoteredinibacter isoporae]